MLKNAPRGGAFLKSGNLSDFVSTEAGAFKKDVVVGIDFSVSVNVGANSLFVGKGKGFKAMAFKKNVVVGVYLSVSVNVAQYESRLYGYFSAVDKLCAFGAVKLFESRFVGGRLFDSLPFAGGMLPSPFSALAVRSFREFCRA